MIDADYRGKVGVLLFNLGDKDFESGCPTLFCLLFYHAPSLQKAHMQTFGFTTLCVACATVKEGDRIAQLILEKIVTPEPQEVSSLDETVRGAGGFGSTGGFGVDVTPASITEAEKK